MLARIRALRRRANSPLRASLEWGDLCLEPNSCQVKYGEQSLHLTFTEYSLLELFLRHHNRVFSYGDLTDYLWSFKEAPTEATIRSHIKRLRQKLNAAGSPTDIIETVYGLGYRLKTLPSKEQTQSRQNHFWLDPDQKQRTLAAIIKSWERLKPGVLNQVALLEQTATVWQKGTCSDELWQQATTEAHKLAGLLGTFGFAKGSELSHEMEDLLRTGMTFDRDRASRFWKLARALRRLLERPLKERKAQVQAALPALRDKLPRLLIVDEDVELTERLRQEAANWRIQVEVASSPLAARTQIMREPPDAVLLDLCFADGPEAGLTLLALNTLASIPVLIFTERGNFADRLKVSRLRTHTFLQKPMAPKLVMAAVNRALQLRVSEAQVLVVDDDPQMLVLLRTLLEPLGLKLTTLVDPRQLWHTLERVVPDLLIVDVKMPHVDGIELCQVVRNDPRWSGLPIMALTAYADSTTVQRVFTAGADDVVGKPIVEPELVTRIVTRLERAQLP